ncbi:MAG TPA: hypothetical protein VKZ74_05495 [Natronosporangium sp.]|nr:hypothetical protein [Natronosporangium sp.]
MRAIRTVVAFALAVVVAAGCAEGGEPGPAPTGRTPTVVSSPAPAPAVTTPAETDPGADPGVPRPPAPAPSGPLAPPTAPRGSELTLTGDVVAGVEHGCKLLSTGEGDYLLFGSRSEELRYGTTVTVRGRLRPDIASICQQGTPFEVTEVLD